MKRGSFLRKFTIAIRCVDSTRNTLHRTVTDPKLQTIGLVCQRGAQTPSRYFTPLEISASPRPPVKTTIKHYSKLLDRGPLRTRRSERLSHFVDFFALTRVAAHRRSPIARRKGRGKYAQKEPMTESSCDEPRSRQVSISTPSSTARTLPSSIATLTMPG